MNTFNNKSLFVLCSNGMELEYIKAPRRALKCLSISKSIELINIGSLPTEKLPMIPDHILENEVIDDMVMIIDLHYMQKKGIVTYLKQYENYDNTLESFVITILMNNILLSEYDSGERHLRRLQQLITCEDAMHWQIAGHCQIDITTTYIDRDVDVRSYLKNTDTNIKSSCLPIDKSISDYLSEMLNYTSRYVDASIANIYYPMTNVSKLTIDKETYTYIFKNKLLGNKELTQLLIMTLIMPNYCHLVINNKDLLEYFGDDVQKIFSSRTFKTYMYYAWTSFYLEESKKKSKMVETDRFIFDIDTASMLPSISHTNDAPNNYEYLAVLVDKDVPTLKNNLHAGYVDKRYNYILGPCNKKKFIKRMNIFIIGTDNYLFDNVNWDYFCVTGSIMACCLPNYNPKMGEFINDEEWLTHNFLNFVNEYYADADVDIAVKGTTEEFIDRVFEIRDIIETNIRRILPDYSWSSYSADILQYNGAELYEPSNLSNETDIISPPVLEHSIITKEYNSSSNIVRIKFNIMANMSINYATIRKYFYTAAERSKLEKEQLTDKDILKKYEDILVNINRGNNINSKDSERLINTMYEIYLYTMREKNETVNGKYLEKHVILPKENVRIFLSDNKKEEVKLNIGINVKYTFECEAFLRKLELFNIKGESFFANVSQFHFPIVRSYYNAGTVKMTPSCFMACKTLYNIDYKFFAGIRDPVQTWIKYHLRGFGFIFNSKELARMISFCKNNPEYAAKYPHINFSSKSSIEHFLSKKYYAPSSVPNNISNDYKIPSRIENQQCPYVNIVKLLYKCNKFPLFKTEKPSQKTIDHDIEFNSIKLDDLTELESIDISTPRIEPENEISQIPVPTLQQSMPVSKKVTKRAKRVADYESDDESEIEESDDEEPIPRRNVPRRRAVSPPIQDYSSESE